MKMFAKLISSYTFVLLAALVIALAWPRVGLVFSPHTTLILEIIFFLSSLKLNVVSAFHDTKKIKPVLLANAYMLIIFPIVTYVVASYLAPHYALALLLLAAMPAGMTSVLLTELVGGSAEFALILTIITSLFSPFTVPLMIKLLAGTAVAVPALSMFYSLLTIIAVPFILAQIVQHFFHAPIQKFFPAFKIISKFLLGFIILGVVSGQASAITSNIGSFIPALLVLFIFFALLHAAGFFGVPGLSRADRLATTVCLSYMNFTLAIYLAGKFFPDPAILVPVILSAIPWSLSFLPFKAIVSRQT